MLLATGFIVPAAAQTEPPSAWRGHLEVLRQEGPGCATEPRLPFKVPVHGVAADGGLVLWGAMQTARLRARAAGEPHDIELLEASGSRGEAALAVSGDGITGEWRERRDASAGGCTYALGRLELVRLSSPEAAREQAALADFLQSMHAAQRAVLQARAREQAREAVAQLQALVRRLPAPGGADQVMAQAFLDSAEQLAALRERGAALSLAEAASTLYRRIADHQPESAALALAANARMARRAGDAAAGDALLGEAVSLLAKRERLDSEAGASVLTQQGSWRRARGDLGGAVESFGRALLADERRGATPELRAMSLTNLGAVLADAGQTDRARQCLEAALALAGGPSDGRSTLADVIREHLATLARREQGPSGRT